MKLKNLLALVTGIFFSVEVTSAQTTFQRILSGGSGGYGAKVQQTTDGGYIIVGTALQFNATDHADIYLIKLDGNGDTVWTKTYGGTEDEYGNAVQQTTDGGYIICGKTFSFGTGDWDVYLLKTDATGNILWTKTFGGLDYDEGTAVEQTSDGGYVVAGNSSHLGVNYVYLIRTGENGNAIYKWKLGAGTASSVQQTIDGGFIIAGSTTYFGEGDFDIYVIKTNALGNVLWSKTYDNMGSSEFGYSIEQTSDSGYIIVGQTIAIGINYWDCYLIKTDVNGTLLWSKTYGGLDYDAGFSVQQTADNGYILAGQTLSFLVGAVDDDVYVIKTDADGDTLWTRIFAGAGWESAGHSVQQTNDGGYVIVGNEVDETGPGIFIIKTDASGNAGCNQAGTATIVTIPLTGVTSDSTVASAGGADTTPSYTDVGSGGTDNTFCSGVGVNEIIADHSVFIYPNPFTTEFVVKGTKENGLAVLFDETGKEMMRQKTFDTETKISITDLPSGFYSLHYTEENKTVNIKLAKF